MKPWQALAAGCPLRERDLTSRTSIRREERKSFRITDVEENWDREQEEEKEKGGEWKADT